MDALKAKLVAITEGRDPQALGDPYPDLPSKA